MHTAVPAIIYSISISIVVIFQFGLAVGLPWGAASMGGKYPGKYPPKMRIVALVNILVLSVLALIVLARSSLLMPELFSFSRYAIWFVVVFSFVGILLNSITPSKIERIWVPVTIVQFITSLMVALN